jgi:hypothetical protein
LIVSLRVSPEDVDGRDSDIVAIGTLVENFQKFYFQEAANFKRSSSDENKITHFTVVCSYYKRYQYLSLNNDFILLLPSFLC